MKKRISNREYEVLDQVSLGYTTDEIASNLYISAHTVITHRKSLCRKLKARNAPGLIRKAFETGVLKPGLPSITSSEGNWIKNVVLTCLIFLIAMNCSMAQSPLADIEGDIRVRGVMDIHHSIDSTILLIGYRAGEDINELISQLDGPDELLFPVSSTIVGSLAGQHSTGGFNSFFGFGAGKDGGLGSFNSYYGFGAGNRTTGDDNTFLGFQSGILNIEGFDNVFIGSNTAFNNTEGSYNTFVGKSSGVNNVTGESNTFVGWQAGSNNRTGHSNTIIGESANFAQGLDSLTRSIAIGFNADVACHNCAAIGGVGEDAVNVGIGVASPLSSLHVVQKSVGPTTGLRLEVNTESDTITGNIYLNLSKKLNFSIENNRVGYIDDVTGDYMATSDARLKKDITNLGPVMSRVMMLTPYWYRYLRNQEEAYPTLGFMAQDLQEYFPDLVSDSEGSLAISYSKIGVLAIKGIQEQQLIIEQQARQLEILYSQLKSVVKEIEKLKAYDK